MLTCCCIFCDVITASKVRIPTEVLSGQYNYGFSLELMRKDVGQATDFLDGQGLDLQGWSSSIKAVLDEAMAMPVVPASSGVDNVSTSGGGDGGGSGGDGAPVDPGPGEYSASKCNTC